MTNVLSGLSQEHSTLLRKTGSLNWEGLELPTKVKDIHKFETNNEVGVNVFRYDYETKKVFTLRLSKASHELLVNLFLYDEHYNVVKNMSRLVYSQCQ